ncbi:glycoside hydrolase family 15 protein [Chryseosolibacter indicus]|uniref:Glycoside hydrolase family 15 protein n=1 Tax=Chryseosolibacter indicus TaxID=2782351 RepID=A0ABS5VN61_9BACT|nr:glycoside hydrolase family 15 protein [Chryseosolibacter indicus]MBT1702873.1 glycoside hydrolase family 15 protein [Chryseosolibacter indicus]
MEQDNNEYQPIENYGVIGDLNTVALVGLNGSIDFMCFPYFDSPTIFAAILDKDKGGYFKITPEPNHTRQKQLYLPDTNVLLTRFLERQGIGEIADFMPVQSDLISKRLIRIVTCVHGHLHFTMECRPRFNYGRTGHTVHRQSDTEILLRSSDGKNSTDLRFSSTIPLNVKDNDIEVDFTLNTGDSVIFILEYLDGSNTKGNKDLRDYASKSLYDTINYWKSWVSRGTYKGRWMETVYRSALVLKLMTSKKHGSIIASPTFGLPEEIGGVRNWDYRYTWIRDASFSVYTLLKLGYKRETRDFIHWVEKQCNEIAEAGSLQLMYRIDGSKELEEQELDHLSGYKNTRPVRIGNAAYNQVQLDIYGELLDAIYLYDKHAEPISYDFWCNLSRQVDWVCDHWHTPDQGIWEVRGGEREFLYSRMMCWVALDRAMKIAKAHSFPLPGKWRKERDKIFISIHEEFWNEDLKCFVQYKGADSVDAATLLMPLVRFIAPKDPRWLSTLKRIEEQLVSDSLVYRYRPDESMEGLTGGEGTFSMCTFWYVECLAKSGQLNKARLCFEKMLGYANHAGLYAEQLGLQGEHLGNFPQAFTHLGLISAALSLDKQFNDQRNKEEEEIENQ